MKDQYILTRRACYLGIMIQSLILNLSPRFFVALREQFSNSFVEIGRLVLITFLVQLCVDFLAAYFVSAIPARLCMILAESAAAGGLILFSVLPNIMSNAYAGMIIAATVYSVGAGLSEVMISPIVDAIPSKDKTSAMTLLHGFYPIGQVLVVLLTTLSVAAFGEQYWPLIMAAWAILPLVNLVIVTKMTFPPMLKGTEKTPIHTLLKRPYFWLMIILMVCAGAAEISMSQWASLFAEEALGVSKLVGDLLGPCLFAVFMGLGRLLHGVKGSKLPMLPLLLICSIATVFCYLLTVFAVLPILSLIGCALCGLAVSLMWPGVLGVASVRFPKGSTSLFALLALGGDIGCSLGPWLTGLVADTTSYGLKGGLLTAALFPMLMVILLIVAQKKKVEN